MKIHLLGDSLVQTRQSGHGEFYRGWGDMLSAFISPETEIINYSMGGRSSRSFLNEGRFIDNGQFTTKIPPFGVGSAFERIEKGDYVLIQFMCNDDNSTGIAYRVNKQVDIGKPNKDGVYPTIVPDKDMLTKTANWDDICYRESLIKEGHSEEKVEQIMLTTKELISMCGTYFYPYDAGATYKGYLKYYIEKVRERGATPILVISGAKLKFVDNKIKPTPGYYGGCDEFCDFTYVEAQKQLSSEMSVPIVNLFETEKNIYEKIGREKAALFHNISVCTDDVKRIDNLNYSELSAEKKDWVLEFDKRHEEHDFISVDPVHKNPFGAYFQAALIAEDLLNKGILKNVLTFKPRFLTQIPEKLKSNNEVFSCFDIVKLF